MYQPMNVMLTIDKVHTAPQRTLNCRPGLGGLNQAYMTLSSKLSTSAAM